MPSGTLPRGDKPHLTPKVAEVNVVGYVRVSTIEQATEGISLDAQRERVEAYVTARGQTCDEIYSDEGISGKRADNRPGLQAALDRVCETRGLLVVYSLSRLARSTRDAINIAERLRKAGADLASISEEINTSSAAGKMIFRLLAVLAEFERDLISERTKGALHFKKTKGERVGQLPYGYTVDRDGIQLVPIEPELLVINQIAEWRQAGATLQKIADRLEALKIPSKGGQPKWHPSTIASILLRKSHEDQKQP